MISSGERFTTRHEAPTLGFALANSVMVTPYGRYDSFTWEKATGAAFWARDIHSVSELPSEARPWMKTYCWSLGLSGVPHSGVSPSQDTLASWRPSRSIALYFSARTRSAMGKGPFRSHGGTSGLAMSSSAYGETCTNSPRARLPCEDPKLLIQGAFPNVSLSSWAATREGSSLNLATALWMTSCAVRVSAWAWRII